MKVLMLKLYLHCETHFQQPSINFSFDIHSQIQQSQLSLWIYISYMKLCSTFPLPLNPLSIVLHHLLIIFLR